MSEKPQTHQAQSNYWKLATLISGGVAGSIAEIASMPVDTLKVDAMVNSKPANLGPIQGIMYRVKTIYNTKGGFPAFFGGRTGATAAVQRQMVMNSVKIGAYENVRKFYCDLFGVSEKSGAFSLKCIKILSGCTTGFVAVCIGQPTDVVKVRTQAEPGRYKSTFQAYHRIYTTEGVSKGLWRGTVPGSLRSALVTAAEVGSFDIIETALVENRIMKKGFLCWFVSGIAVGCIATAVASPADVIKTVYTNSKQGQYKNLLSCVRHLWAENGFLTFYKGAFFNGSRLVLWNVFMFVSFRTFREKIEEMKEERLTMQNPEVMERINQKAPVSDNPLAAQQARQFDPARSNVLGALVDNDPSRGQ